MSLRRLHELNKHLEHDELELINFFYYSPDIFLICSRQEIILVNAAYTHFLGWTTEESINQPWFDRIHPDDHALSRLAAQQLEEGPITSFIIRNRHKNGTYLSISWSASDWLNNRCYCIGRPYPYLISRPHPVETTGVNQPELISLQNYIPAMLLSLLPDDPVASEL